MRLSSNVIKKVNCELESCAVYSQVGFGLSDQSRQIPSFMDAESIAKETAAILAQARAEADELVQQAQAQVGRIAQEAYEQGYQQGVQAARQEAEQTRRNFDQAAGKLLQDLEALQDYVYHETEKEMIELAVEVAEKLVGQQLDLWPETIVELAKSACEQARDCKQIVLYVSPQQLDAIKIRQDEIGELFYRSEHFAVVADPAIKAGGCRIETEYGYIDARRETMAEQIEKIIKEA